MQLKSRIKNLDLKNKIPAQAVLQNFMMERLLDRISISKYKDIFILKGGMLIASMIGIGSRTTMDMDATIRGYPLLDGAIQDAFTEICAISLNDEVTLKLNSITPIRDEDEYGGYRLMITARYEAINTPLKVDITTGDIITPEAVRYTFHSSFEEKRIEIWAYNIETILAEKVETILRRSVLNTRLRDFYDVYILMRTQLHMMDKDIFITALNATARKRGSLAVLQDKRKILQAIQSDLLMRQRWDLYCKENFYASNTEFDDVIDLLQK
ncbi:MAG: nucleotidyl transferase AbiEii/AbiGii toxin family protein [Chloroflexi bacterium]|nr:nucleotidyl transferase AbiEii/AbiGii toxin family protein [Chloroflexota bacterium]